jgi:lysozyme
MKKDVFEFDVELAYPIVKEYEGLRLSAYRCPAGVPTIGWGHTRGVKMGDKITREKAEEFLHEDLIAAQDNLSVVVKVPVTRGQFIGLIDLMFNLGLSKCRSYFIWGLVNSGNEKAAAEKFLQYGRSRKVDKNGKPVLDEKGEQVWEILPGLRSRREAEKRAFES